MKSNYIEFIIILKLFLEYSYINYVYKYFVYNGFTYAFDFNRYLIGLPFIYS